MANPILDPVVADVTDAIGVMQSARVLIGGFQQKLADAVQAALKNGATAEELAPLTALDAALKTEKQALADAVAANP